MPDEMPEIHAAIIGSPGRNPSAGNARGRGFQDHAVTRTVEEAQWLLRAGRIEEAEQVFTRVLDESPFDLQALNIVALAAIRLGHFHRARDLLKRAVAVGPDHAASHHHLGRAEELIGDLEQARSCYHRATTLSAELPAARLHLAAVLEKLGQGHAALVQYVRVMGDQQRQGRWLDPAATPPALQPLVAHAAQVVRNGSRALYFDLIELLAAEFGRSRQQPTFLYFPDLPTTPYFDCGLFPGLEAIEAQAPAILAELQALLGSNGGSNEVVFTSAELAAQNLRSHRGEPGWTGYYFYRHGERRDTNCAACPVTSAALEQLPLCHVEAHGPEVLFSVFTPGTHLLPHRGVTNTRVVGHLPLIVPPDCALNVGGEVHAWRQGRAVVFDDTYEHEAWNRSAETRVVLIFDLWNPHLADVERAAVAKLVHAIGEFRHAVEAA
ncbi:MAG: aspartyl beta-hydroxylase [Gammaproteobacteria bacterium PRO9]|nr:aspartyl beta-hydroxylase [Gammaproteobacteria bacterium PRO9]